MAFYKKIAIIELKRLEMNDTTDMATLTIRMVIFLVVAGVFLFVLKSKKGE